MGESDTARNRGIPATPRLCLVYSTHVILPSLKFSLWDLSNRTASWACVLYVVDVGIPYVGSLDSRVSHGNK